MTMISERPPKSADPTPTAARSTRLQRFRTGPLPWLIPSMLVLACVSLYPTVFAIINSFRFYNLGVAPIPLGFNGLDNYRNVLTDSGFQSAVVQTLIFCIVVSLVELVLGVLLALLLREKLFGTSIARSVLIMPVAVAPTVVGLAFRSMYTSDTGLIPNVLQIFGIDVPPEGILGSTSTAFPALMVSDIWQWTPFVALIALAAMQGISEEVLEAARIDGAGPVRILRSMILPLIKSALVTVMLLRFIQSFNVFDIVYIETRGGPGGSTTTVGMEIYLAGLNNYNIGLASAMTMIAAIGVGIIVNIYLFAADRNRRTTR